MLDVAFFLIDIRHSTHGPKHYVVCQNNELVRVMNHDKTLYSIMSYGIAAAVVTLVTSS